jgi:hypothetical protein
MKAFNLAATGLILLAVTAGCASGDVEGRRSYAAGEQIPRPGRIIVYDFAATADDLAASAAITGRYAAPATPQSAEVVRLGRELGSRVAGELVKDILAMGLPAERARGAAPPNIGDIVFVGRFAHIDKGDRTKRMIIGFGVGAAELRTVVEGYHITLSGPRLLKSLDIKAAGGKAPGMAAPLVIVGGIFGNPVTAAAVSGGLNIVQELGPERIEGAADRTAKAVAKELRAAFKRRGWI